MSIPEAAWDQKVTDAYLNYESWDQQFVDSSETLTLLRKAYVHANRGEVDAAKKALSQAKKAFSFDKSILDEAVDPEEKADASKIINAVSTAFQELESDLMRAEIEPPPAPSEKPPVPDWYYNFHTTSLDLEDFEDDPKVEVEKARIIESESAFDRWITRSRRMSTGKKVLVVALAVGAVTAIYFLITR